MRLLGPDCEVLRGQVGTIIKSAHTAECLMTASVPAGPTSNRWTQVLAQDLKATVVTIEIVNIPKN